MTVLSYLDHRRRFRVRQAAERVSGEPVTIQWLHGTYVTLRFTETKAEMRSCK
jgi:predicted N-acyltransferase